MSIKAVIVTTDNKRVISNFDNRTKAVSFVNENRHCISKVTLIESIINESGATPEQIAQTIMQAKDGETYVKQFVSLLQKLGLQVRSPVVTQQGNQPVNNPQQVNKTQQSTLPTVGGFAPGIAKPKLS